MIKLRYSQSRKEEAGRRHSDNYTPIWARRSKSKGRKTGKEATKERKTEKEREREREREREGEVIMRFFARASALRGDD